jgi:hypothetical protein
VLLLEVHQCLFTYDAVRVSRPTIDWAAAFIATEAVGVGALEISLWWHCHNPVDLARAEHSAVDKQKLAMNDERCASLRPVKHSPWFVERYYMMRSVTRVVTPVANSCGRCIEISIDLSLCSWLLILLLKNLKYCSLAK